MRAAASQLPERWDEMMAFYGVGNHGGGPTRENLDSIRRLDGVGAIKEIRGGKAELGPIRRMFGGKVVLGPPAPTGAGDNNPGRRGDPAPGMPDAQADPYGDRAQRKSPPIKS